MEVCDTDRTFAHSTTFGKRVGRVLRARVAINTRHRRRNRESGKSAGLAMGSGGEMCSAVNRQPTTDKRPSEARN